MGRGGKPSRTRYRARWNTWNDCGRACLWCGTPLALADAVFETIRPILVDERARRGNFFTSCSDCADGREGRTIDEYLKVLRRKRGLDPTPIRRRFDATQRWSRIDAKRETA